MAEIQNYQVNYLPVNMVDCLSELTIFLLHIVGNHLINITPNISI